MKGPLPAGISETIWMSWPVGALELILAQQEIQALRQEIAEPRSQLSALATDLVSL